MRKRKFSMLRNAWMGLLMLGVTTACDLSDKFNGKAKEPVSASPNAQAKTEIASEEKPFILNLGTIQGFAFDSHEVTPEMDSAAARLARRVKSIQDKYGVSEEKEKGVRFQLRITGGTDTIGNPGYNEGLALSRSIEFSNKIVQHFRKAGGEYWVLGEGFESGRDWKLPEELSKEDEGEVGIGFDAIGESEELGRSVLVQLAVFSR